MTDSIPVITLDGPAASGKGMIAARVADALGFYYLDSGALYRIATLNALSKGIDLDDADALTASAEKLEPVFDGDRILLEGRDVTTAIRAEEVSAATSRVAAVPGVRAALFALQKNAARLPGLVADGRDMGTVVFPDAPLKIFMTATAADLAALTVDLEERDRRDRQRAEAPLKPADDARILDTSDMGIDEVVQTVIAWWKDVGLKGL